MDVFDITSTGKDLTLYKRQPVSKLIAAGQLVTYRTKAKAQYEWHSPEGASLKVADLSQTIFVFSLLFSINEFDGSWKLI